ncbi:MAG: hypothetical protein EZS28_024096 [Streblomastix strix]|uniref:Uncharacterized protein n=1 Tax=Streblomastix strix TaxID=222440 RepID=A0A5J4VD22_9EUKA|nr:MAG: hypothetical protein EZS28_024096 [Streblomastix strix]
MTCESMRAVLNKQLGRQAIKNIVFFECLESLTKWHWILYRQTTPKYSIAEHLLEQLTFQIKAGILNRNISKEGKWKRKPKG